jgi:hypothetical protein
MPDEEKKCTPFSLSLMVQKDDENGRRFNFGIARGCNEDDESTWGITFKLEEKDGDEWKVRVDFRLDINQEAPAKTEKAREMADKKELSTAQRNFVRGPMYVAAIREGQARPKEDYLDSLNRLSEWGIGLVDDANKLSTFVGGESEGEAQFLSEFQAAYRVRKRPGLKELSIAFLDID